MLFFLAALVLISGSAVLPVCNAETGGEQIIKALNAGIARIAETGEWWTLTQNYAAESGNTFDNFYYFIETFAKDGAYSPFPVQPTGRFAHILENRTITVVQINTQIPIRRVGPTDQASGRDAILQAIMAEVAAHYGIAEGITIEYHAYMPPSSDKNLWRTTNEPGSTREDINDCITSIAGLYVHPVTKVTVPRTSAFLPTYPVLSNVFQAYVAKHSRFFTAQQLIAAAKAGEPLTICYNTNNGNVVRSTFTGEHLSFIKPAADVAERTCMESLLAGETDVFFSEYTVRNAEWINRSKIVRFGIAAPTAFWTANW